MTDITERLRAYVIGDQLYHPLVCSEAADEITKLRAALTDCIALLDEDITGVEQWNGIINEARALLSRE